MIVAKVCRLLSTHETQVLDTPYTDVTRRFFRSRNDGMRQPDIVHRMYRLFKDADILDVHVGPLTRVTTNYQTFEPAAHFIEGMRSAHRHSVVTAEEVEQWIAFLTEAIRTGHFFHTMTWFIMVGRKSQRDHVAV